MASCSISVLHVCCSHQCKDVGQTVLQAESAAISRKILAGHNWSIALSTAHYQCLLTMIFVENSKIWGFSCHLLLSARNMATRKWRKSWSKQGSDWPELPSRDLKMAAPMKTKINKIFLSLGHFLHFFWFTCSHWYINELTWDRYYLWQLYWCFLWFMLYRGM